MLSDVSDLSDLSDDEYIPPKPRNNTGRASKTDKIVAGRPYQLKKSLRPPRVTTYPAQTLFDQISSGFINLNPDYQRDVVWPESKQSGLIDSMLRNYYIPPVIFAVSTDEEGNEIRTCIDGKQRLTSIQRFMDGFIPHKDSHSNLKMWYQYTKNNTSGKLLPPNLKQQFAYKQVMCVEYEGIAEDAEREIFMRVQLGMALTPAERMHAITGPWPDLIREIIRNYFPSSSSAAIENSRTSKRRTEDLAQLIEWSATRGRDFHLIAVVLFYFERDIMKVSDVPTHPAAPTLEKWLSRPAGPSAELRRKIHEVFKIFILFARDKVSARIFWKPNRISPAEFIAASILVSRKMGECTLEMLVNAIAKMKADVRSRFEDIRANTRILKHMFEFLFKKFPKRQQLESKVRNSGSDRDERPAMIVARSFNVGVPPSSTNPGGKRKRSEETSSESETSDSGEDEKSEEDEHSDSEADPNSVPITSTPKKRGRPPKAANTGARDSATKTTKKDSATSSSSTNVRAAKLKHFLTKQPSTPSSSNSTSASSTLAGSVQKSIRISESQKSSPSSARAQLARKPKLKTVNGRGSSTQDPIDLSLDSDIDWVAVKPSNPAQKTNNGIVAVKQEKQEPALFGDSNTSVTPSQESAPAITKERASDNLSGAKSVEADKDESDSEGEDIRMVDSTLSHPSHTGAAVAQASTTIIPAETAISANTSGIASLANIDLTTLLQIIMTGQAHLMQLSQTQVQNQTPPRPAMMQPPTSPSQDGNFSTPQTPSVNQSHNTPASPTLTELQSVLAQLAAQQHSLPTLSPLQYTPQRPADGTVNPQSINTQLSPVDTVPKTVGLQLAANPPTVPIQGTAVANGALQLPAISTPASNSGTTVDRPAHLPPRPVTVGTAVPQRSVHWDRSRSQSIGGRRVHSQSTYPHLEQGGPEDFNRDGCMPPKVITRDNGWKGFNERKAASLPTRTTSSDHGTTRDQARGHSE